MFKVSTLRPGHTVWGDNLSECPVTARSDTHITVYMTGYGDVQIPLFFEGDVFISTSPRGCRSCSIYLTREKMLMALEAKNEKAAGGVAIPPVRPAGSEPRDICLDIGAAMQWLKQGKRVARVCFSDSDQTVKWLMLQPHALAQRGITKDEIERHFDFNLDHLYKYFFNIQPSVLAWTSNQDFAPWTPAFNDLFADDWYVEHQLVQPWWEHYRRNIPGLPDSYGPALGNTELRARAEMAAATAAETSDVAIEWKPGEHREKAGRGRLVRLGEPGQLSPTTQLSLGKLSLSGDPSVQ